MADLLSQKEHFEDRIEIAGYVTAGVTAIFLLTFFGMIFFYKPVRNLPPITQLLTLVGSIFVLTFGFFIPKGKNMARILYRLFFLWFGTYAYFKAIDQGEWLFLPILLYSVYLIWVLGHPVGIEFFRPLKPHEERQKSIGNGLTWHVTLLLFTICIMGLKGFMIISSQESDPLYDPDRGMLFLFLSLVFWFLLIFFRRVQNWARWCLGLIILTIGVFNIPDTVSHKTTHYLAYWKLLALVFYCFGLALYLFFSKRVKKAFRPAPATEAK